MNLQCISEHTIDLSLINRQSKVLDLGCRSFGWASQMLHYVDTVYCVDADNDVRSFNKRMPVMNVAVSDTNDQVVQFIKHGNGTGNYIHRGTNPKPAKCKEQVANTLTLPAIVNAAFGGTTFIDLIKCDIEREEVRVIQSLTAPPAKQLSIEFHKHCGSTDEEVLWCFDKLGSLGYVLVFNDYSEKYGCGINWWDTLFILK